jgi:hypothetical protein
MPTVFSKSDLDNHIRNYLQLAPNCALPKSINGQLNRFIVELNYSPLDIARAVSYYVEVQGHKLEKLYGIWFVPDVIDDARKYFNDLAKKKAQKEAEALIIETTSAQDKLVYNVNVKVIAERKIPRKLEQIDLTKIDISGDDNGGK